MYAAYLFSVVLGGGLMVLSIFGDLLGGDAGDIELDAEVDVDFDADTDVDSAASKIFSFRTATYALFGFGGVGWLLTQLGFAAAAPTTVAYAVGGGLVSGAMVQGAFNYLRRTDSGLHEGDDSFVGLPGAVVLPLGGGSHGSVAIERGDRRHSLRALPHAGASSAKAPSEWTNVVVVEMREGVAYVVPSDEDLTALP